ncbi:MAG: discoidin domain-containing protein [Acidobacteria bacterium]|nr:discoidin domain-containing protein [Acidobacteriota bacterium]
MKNQAIAPRVCGSLLLASTVAFAVACSGEHNPTAPSIASAPPVAEGVASVSEFAGNETASTLAAAKTTICHKTGGAKDYVVTQIADSALATHMAHGDMNYSPVSLKTATYSASRSPETASLAFDGNPLTSWIAGSHPLQWIEIDFGSPQSFWTINALVDQNPSGQTNHRVALDGNTAFSWNGLTGYGDLLSHKFDTLQTAQKVRITTTQSPSWVAWQEVTFPTCS